MHVINGPICRISDTCIIYLDRIALSTLDHMMIMVNPMNICSETQ